MKKQTEEDFYKLAYSLKVYQEFRKTLDEIELYDYKTVVEKLDGLTNIPPKLSKEVS